MNDDQDLIAWENITAEDVRDDLPWFYFDAAKWVIDRKIIGSTDAEKGVYIQLLAHCWVDKDCSLDPKPSVLCAQLGSKRELKRHRNVIEKFFSEHPYLDGMVTQKRLMYERVRAVTSRKKRSNAGKKGMRSRWQKDNIVIKKIPAKDNIVITSKNKNKNKNNIKTIKTSRFSTDSLKKMETRFEKVWSLYDKKAGKAKAKAAFIRGYKKEGVLHYKKMVYTNLAYIRFMKKEWDRGFKDREFMDGKRFFETGYMDHIESFNNRFISKEQGSIKKVQQPTGISEDHFKKWVYVLNQIQGSILPENFEKLFDTLAFGGIESSRIIILVSGKKHGEYLRTNYSDVIQEAIQTSFSSPEKDLPCIFRIGQ